MVRRIRSLACAAVLAVAVVVLAPAGPASATDPTDGLRVESDATYTVDLAHEVIEVEMLLRLTNELADEVSADRVRSFVVSKVSVPILPGATNVTARWEGGAPLRVSVEPGSSALLALATVDLVPDLEAGPTKAVRLRYEVPPQPPRSGAPAQVNEAFATLPVFTSADPGLGSVTVVVPEGTEVEVAGAELTRGAGDGVVTYTASGIADPADWFATLVVRDDDALVSREVRAGDDVVRVQAWPQDTEWLDFTGDLLERGVPALRAAIGRDWTLSDWLDVVETSTPYLYGYGGWFDPQASVIEVGDALDAHVVLHEVAHAWFNGRTFEGRWISEALADEFASLAMVELGMERPVPEAVDPDAPGAVRLNAWTTPSLQDAPRDQEEYGYAATSWLAHALAQEIGPAALADVVGAAMDLASPYPAPTDPGRPLARADWRAFLDHLEGVGGSQRATELFRTYVVTPAEAAMLDARQAARAEYAALLADGDGWAPPAVLRDAMARWEFDEAVAMVPQVREAFAQRRAITAALEGTGTPVPDALQAQVEGAEALGELEATTGRARAAADALARAVAAEAGANPLARVGMLAIPAQRDLERARDAFADGAWDAARRAADASVERIATATYAGGGAVLLVVLAGVGGLVARRRPGGGPQGPDPVATAPDDATPPRAPEPDGVLHG